MIRCVCVLFFFCRCCWLDAASAAAVAASFDRLSKTLYILLFVSSRITHFYTYASVVMWKR